MFTLFLDKEEDIEKIFLYSTQKLADTNIIIEKCSNSIIFRNISSFMFFSSWLTKLIIDIFEKNLISKIINKTYCYFEETERLKISDISSSIIDENLNSKNDLIFIAIYDYLKSFSEMNLDGFIRFRLKDYLDVLEYLVDLSVNNFIINREYDRFINLLVEYVDNKPSKIEQIHLIYLNQESILLDTNQNLIPIDSNILDAKYLSDISFSSNDYALNTILKLLPNKLYVHILDKEDEFINTLRKIFKNRLYMCKDCNICNFYRLTILK